MNRVLILTLLFLSITFTAQGDTKKNTKGTYFDASRVQYIKKWRTGQEDIVRLFGKPIEKERKSRFDEVWTYMYYETEQILSDKDGRDGERSRPGEARSLEITFRKGVVADFSLVEFNTPIRDFEKPMVFSGFSLKPPGDPAWKILMKTKREVSFVRETGNGDHRIIAFFSSVHGTAGGIKGADDLERAARDRLEKLIKNPEVKNLKLKRTPVTIDGRDGIELRGTLKTVAGGKPGRNDSAIRIYHVCVLHPNPERDEMVHMGYTQRLFKGEKGPDVEKEISAAVASFKFRDGEN